MEGLNLWGICIFVIPLTLIITVGPVAVLVYEIISFIKRINKNRRLIRKF